MTTAVSAGPTLGLGEWHVTADRGMTLTCLGLGSCVAFIAWDPIAKVGGMAHMVLPDSTVGRGGAPGKFVDTAIPLVLSTMQGAGALRSRLHIYLVGGAQMLAARTGNDQLLIGDRNARAAQAMLSGLGLRVKAEETGGKHGRTVRLDVDSGEVHVSSAGQPARML